MDTPEEGMTITLQYWQGDSARALRLARLLANIERAPRHDVTLALCRRADCPESDDLRATLDLCRMTFPTMAVAIEDPMSASVATPYGPSVPERSPRTGHPDGANALWSGTVKLFAERWQAGNGRPSIFTIEHDGCPLSVDWIDRLQLEHERALRAGKRVTGCMMELPGPTPHPNGSLIIHASAWLDHPSLWTTPNQQAWDVYHRVVLGAECQPTSLIRNIYAGRDYTPGVLAALSKETAFLVSTKDDSAIEWAERTLTPVRDKLDALTRAIGVQRDRQDAPTESAKAAPSEFQDIVTITIDVPPVKQAVRLTDAEVAQIKDGIQRLRNAPVMNFSVGAPTMADNAHAELTELARKIVTDHGFHPDEYGVHCETWEIVKT